MKDEKRPGAIVTHYSGHVHNPTCGTCQLTNQDDFVYFHHEETDTYSIGLNTRPATIKDPDDFASTEFKALTKKIEVIGLQKPAAIYISYDLCKDKDCHSLQHDLDKYLPDYLDLSDAESFKISKGKIETPYPNMQHFYDHNDSYGFLVEDSNDIPKTLFLNDTNVVLIKKKSVVYKEVVIKIRYTESKKEKEFKLRLAFGLTPR